MHYIFDDNYLYLSVEIILYKVPRKICYYLSFLILFHDFVYKLKQIHYTDIVLCSAYN